MKDLFLKKILMIPFAALFALLFLLSNSVVILMAFEAHVINVTATIERPKLSCDALSIGYWRNHEGCSGGEGESFWTDEINDITHEFAGIFYNITGEEICQALWVPDCPSGNNIPAKRCRATAMALADELNLVSGRLQLEALIAGADDGSSAFDHLGLDYNSTVAEALFRAEQIIGNDYSSAGQLTDAAYVAERIYAFYEDENPDRPYCVTEPQSCGWDSHFLSGSGGTGSYQNDNLESGRVNEDENNSDNDNNNNSNGGDRNGSGDQGDDRPRQGLDLLPESAELTASTTEEVLPIETPAEEPSAGVSDENATSSTPETHQEIIQEAVSEEQPTATSSAE